MPSLSTNWSSDLCCVDGRQRQMDRLGKEKTTHYLTPWTWCDVQIHICCMTDFIKIDFPVAQDLA